MNEKLEQAIAATRNGDKRQAQLQLTQLLEEDPGQVQAWYLLSLLVDSPEKQLTFLGKTLALDPNHAQAKERLANLTAAEVTPSPTPLPRSEDPLDFESQERGETIPDWMEPGEATAVPAAAPEEPEPDTETELPDWLQETVGDEWINQEQPTQASQTKAAATPAKTPNVTLPTPAKKAKKKTASSPFTASSPKPKRQRTSLDYVLYVLIAIAVIILVVLIYVLFTG